ncbi:MAG: hypothetical protein JWM96_845 [Alphaproteobacteria bacterium]|nr:hypothetical protein [Alphaproteobacteria bacterium]
MRLNKRGAGDVGLSDMLVVVLLADAIQNAMAGEYNSISNGILLISTILFWDFAINWASYRMEWLQKLLSPSQVCIVRSGVMLRRNMRSEMITKDELMEQLRLQGIEDIAQVKTAAMESSGKISVVKYKD